MTQISAAGAESPASAFVLMLQYLMQQQQNLTNTQCKTYIDNIALLERDNENLRTTVSTLQEKLHATELQHQSEIQRLQKINTMESPDCMTTKSSGRVRESRTERETQVTNVSYTENQHLDNLRKFFETFFKKELPDCPNKDKALQIAVRTADAVVTTALVKAGCNVDTEDPMSWERTPLHWAAALNHTEIATILIEGGANIESRETGVYSLFTPLHEAAKHGYREMCLLLLDAHANPNSRDGDGSTPLHTAAREGHVSVVELLVSRGATVNVYDKWGLTPKDRAIKYKHTQVVKFFTQVGVP